MWSRRPPGGSDGLDSAPVPTSRGCGRDSPPSATPTLAGRFSRPYAASSMQAVSGSVRATDSISPRSCRPSSCGESETLSSLSGMPMRRMSRLLAAGSRCSRTQVISPYRDDMRRFVEILLDFCATTRPARAQRSRPARAAAHGRDAQGAVGGESAYQARQPRGRRERRRALGLATGRHKPPSPPPRGVWALVRLPSLPFCSGRVGSSAIGATARAPCRSGWPALRHGV